MFRGCYTKMSMSDRTVGHLLFPGWTSLSERTSNVGLADGIWLDRLFGDRSDGQGTSYVLSRPTGSLSVRAARKLGRTVYWFG